MRSKLPLLNPLNSKKPLIIIFGTLLILISLALWRLSSSLPPTNTAQAQTSSQSLDVKQPIAQKDLNEVFSFPIKDNNGKEVTKIKYIIESAEIRDEIIVKGQKATAVQGRAFLILNLKLNNESNNNIEMNTRDFIRMAVTGEEYDWFAPDIHNDLVEVQAISTKFTRLGFPVDLDQRRFKLKVGEVAGDKKTLDLDF